MSVDAYLVTATWTIGAESARAAEPTNKPVESAAITGPTEQPSPQASRDKPVSDRATKKPPKFRAASRELAKLMPWLVRPHKSWPKMFGRLRQIGHGFRYYYSPNCPPVTAAVFWCQCGRYTIAAIANVKAGGVTSCGCRKMSRGGLTIIDGAHCRSYSTWKNLGRGGQIAREWSGDGGYERFLAELGRPPEGTRLCRRIGAKGWAPGNCYWRSEVPDVVFVDADDTPMLRSGKLLQVGPIVWQTRGKRGIRYRCVEVLCDCGSRFVVPHQQLAAGRVTDCVECRKPRQREASRAGRLAYLATQ